MLEFQLNLRQTKNIIKYKFKQFIMRKAFQSIKYDAIFNPGSWEYIGWKDWGPSDINLGIQIQ